MIRLHGTRLSALFLVIAFLAGGYGLTGLDAFLFHSTPHAVRADVAHLDQPGGCGAHAEQCVLALTGARPQYATPASAKVQLGSVVLRAQIPASTIHPPPLRGTLQLPRAPPHASAR